MPSYNLYTCPNCEDHFRLIWPDRTRSNFTSSSLLGIPMKPISIPL